MIAKARVGPRKDLAEIWARAGDLHRYVSRGSEKADIVYEPGKT